MASGHTMVKSTIWSHLDQKYQIEIFGCKVAKTGKNTAEKLYTPLVQSFNVKYSLQVKIFKFYPSGGNQIESTKSGFFALGRLK